MADVSMNIGASPVSLEISDALGPIEMDINPIGLSNSTIGLTLPGPKGEKGDVGAGLNIYGSYPSYEALVAAHPTADPGEAYLIDGHLFVWGKVDNEWIDVGDIQGPQGDPGLDGYSPVKGADYWTDEDKADVIAEVMSNSEAVFQPLTDSLTEETDLADGDAFPFHDASVDAPRKSLWSNIKSKLKSYFDTLYAALAHSHALDDDDEITGVLPIAKGGTGVSAADAAAVMKGLGLCAANAVAYPRGSYTEDTRYLERWQQVHNTNEDDLEPWAITGASGYINGWRVMRAGMYSINALVAYSSGSNPARPFSYIVGVLAENEASIADSFDSNEAVTELAGSNAAYLRKYGPSTTNAESSIASNAVLYLPVGSILLVYSGVKGAAKTQDTNPNFGHFSIARVG
jgi:hypothetical protein